MTNNDDLALKLNELARKAVPGPWGVARDRVTVVSNQSHPVAKVSDAEHRILSDLSTGMDAEFISTANPAAILSLLAERTADKEENASLRQRVAELEEIADLQRDKIKRLESSLWDEQQLRKVHSEKSFELEKENRELKHRNDEDFIWRGEEIVRLNDELDALKEKCAAAGIKLEVRE